MGYTLQVFLGVQTLFLAECPPDSCFFLPLGVSQISPCERTSGQVEISWQSERLIMFKNGRSLPAVCVTGYHTAGCLCRTLLLCCYS